MTVRGAVAIAALVLTVGAMVACDTGTPAPRPIDYAWRQARLPDLPIGERAVIRAATGCGGRWYLTGAVVAADGTPRPAAWESTDTLIWKSMKMEPNTYYGRLNTLYSAGCRFGFLAAIGAKSGGAHGFPRTSNWYQGTDGVMHQIEPPYTLYGGPEGVNVARIVGGPSAWVETGNRSSGAAIWTSADGETFTIVEKAPHLAHDVEARNWANDVVPTTGGWVVAGSTTLAERLDADPAVWMSADTLTWHRVEVSADTEYEEIQRLTTLDRSVIGVGLRGQAFGAWRGDGGAWRSVATFGTSGGPGAGAAAALTTTAGRVIALTHDGASHSVWQSTDGGHSWHTVRLPVVAPVAADKAAAAFALDDKVLLAVDDGTDSSVFVATIPPSPAS